MLTNDLDLRRRDRELTEIAKSIASLAELFKDLSALVIDQGTLLDSVEYNIEQTAVQMEEAVKELDMATRYVESSFPRLDSTSPSRFPPSYRLIIDVEQVPEEHWTKEMHLSPTAHHFWPHPRAYLQATTKSY